MAALPDLVSGQQKDAERKVLKSLEAFQIVITTPRNTLEYKNAFEDLVKASAEDMRIIQEYLKVLLRIDKLKLPIPSNELEKLPNLFEVQPDSPQYSYLNHLLHSWIKSKKLFKALIDNFQKILSEFNQQPTPVVLTAISVILQEYYGQDGANLTVGKEKRSIIKKQIREYLCGYDISARGNETDIPNELLAAFKALRTILNQSQADSQQARLQARDICEALKLPLDLAHMLALSLDGITSQGASDKVEDVVLVVGNTGAGKSTTVNLLSGIKHEYVRDKKDRKEFLQPLPDQKPAPARVGHGLKSQTLYPQVIRSDNITFIDCPGYDDNRDDDQGVCAALGVPLASQYTKRVRAVMVVIEWQQLYERRNNTSFRLLSHTLTRLFKNFSSLASSDGRESTLIFAITRPPVPDRDDPIFDPEQLKDQLLERISEILAELSSNEESFAAKKENEKKIKFELDDFTSCLHELKSLAEPVDFTAKRIPFVAQLSAMLSSESSGLLAEGRIEKILQEQLQKWKDMNLSSGAISHLETILRKVSHIKDEGQRKRVLMTEQESFEKLRDECQERLNNLRMKIEESVGERTILEIMKRSGENLFIIRGYHDDPEDKPDHCADVLKYITQLRQVNRCIESEHFCFDPASKDFNRVREWATSLAGDIEPTLKGLTELPVFITRMSKRIQKREAEIRSYQIELRQEMLRLDVGANGKTELQLSLEEHIKNIETELSELQSEIKVLADQIEMMTKEVHLISHSVELTEYGSAYNIEKRWGINYHTSWGEFWAVNTTWDYNFPGFSKNLADTIPIARVEMSSLIDSQEKIVFRTPLHAGRVPQGDNFTSIATMGNDPHLTCTRLLELGNENVFNVTCLAPIPYRNMGVFTVDKYLLNTGLLKIRYRSNDADHGFAGIRVFVQSKFTPESRRKIAALKADLVKERSRLSELVSEAASMTHRLLADKRHLELLNKLVASGQDNQADKVKRIQQLVCLLGYKKEDFLKDFVPADIVSWLQETYALLRNYASKRDDEFEKIGIGMNANTFRLMLDGLDLHQLVKENSERRLSILERYNLRYEAEAIMRKLLPAAAIIAQVEGRAEQLKMLESSLKVSQHLKEAEAFVKKTGLTLTSLHTLLCWDFSIPEESLPAKVTSYQRSKEAWQYCYLKLKEVYLRHTLPINALITIAKLLDFSGNYFSINRFLNSYKAVQALRDFDCPLIPESQFPKIHELIRGRLLPQLTCYGLNSQTLFTTFSPALILSLSTRDFDPPELVKPTNSLPDGNCAINAVVLGICSLAERNGLNQGAYQLLCFLLNITAENMKYKESIIAWLKTKSSVERQNMLSPKLRVLSIEFIERNYAYYQESYEEGLVAAFDQYREGRNDETFTVHSHIKDQFDILKNELEDREEAEVHRELITWWQTKGKTEYFLQLKQPARGATDLARWGSETEMDALAQLFEMTIRNSRQGLSQLLGMGYGIIRGLTPLQISILEALSLGSRYQGGFRIQVASRSRLEQILNWKRPTQEEISCLHDPNQRAAILKFINEQDASVQIPGVNDLKTFCEKIINLGVLYHHPNDGARPDGTRPFRFVSPETLELLMVNLSEDLKHIVRTWYRPELPSFEVRFGGGHWSYVNEPLPKPINTKNRMQNKELIQLIEEVGLDKDDILKEVERAFSVCSFSRLSIIREEEIKERFEFNQVPALVCKNDGSYEFIIRNNGKIERINATTVRGVDLKGLYEFYEAHKTKARTQISWNHPIMGWLLTAGHKPGNESYFKFVAKVLEKIRGSSSFAKIKFLNNANWLHYLAMVTWIGFEKEVKESIKILLKHGVSPYERTNDEQSQTAFGLIAAGDSSKIMQEFCSMGPLSEFVGVERQVKELQEFLDQIKRDQNTENHFRLLSGPPGVGKTELMKLIAKENGFSIIEFPKGDKNDKWVGQIETRIQKFFDDAKRSQNWTCLIMDEMDAICPPKANISEGYDPDKAVTLIQEKITTLKGTKVVLIGATNFLKSVKEAIRSRAGVPILFSLPNLQQRKQLIEIQLRSNLLQEASIIDDIASAASGWSPRVIKDYLSRVMIRAQTDKQSCIPSKTFIEIFEAMREIIRNEAKENLGIDLIAPSLKVAQTSENVNVPMDPKVERELDIILSFLEDPKDYPDNSMSLLLDGPPGTGKTLFARTVADRSNTVFIYLDATQLLNNGPKALSNSFEAAAGYEKSVIFIDEIDKIAHGGSPYREILQTSMDGFNSKHRVNIMVVIGATNYPGNIAAPVLTRFSAKVVVPLPTESKRAQLFYKLLQNIGDDKKRDKEMEDIERVSRHLAKRTPLFAPRDITNVINNALRNYVFEHKKQASKVLTVADFEEACRAKSVEVASILRKDGQSYPREYFGDEDNWKEFQALIGAVRDTGMSLHDPINHIGLPVPSLLHQYNGRAKESVAGYSSVNSLSAAASAAAFRPLTFHPASAAAAVAANVSAGPGPGAANVNSAAATVERKRL